MLSQGDLHGQGAGAPRSVDDEGLDAQTVRFGPRHLLHVELDPTRPQVHEPAFWSVAVSRQIGAHSPLSHEWVARIES